MATSELLEELLELERAGWDSLCDGTADKFFGGLMAADAVMVLANGMIMDRDAVTSALGQAPPWDRYEISDPRLIVIDTNTAAVVYVGTGYRDSADKPFVGAMSSVYHRGTEAWALVLYQQSTVADAGH